METIYRNLEILSENGRIQKLEGVGTQRRYDGTTENHYHLRFVSCGRVIDLTYKPLKEIEKALFKLGDYDIFSYKSELFGLCLPCKSEKQKINNKSFRNCRKEKAK